MNVPAGVPITVPVKVPSVLCPRENTPGIEYSEGFPPCPVVIEARIENAIGVTVTSGVTGVSGTVVVVDGAVTVVFVVSPTFTFVSVLVGTVGVSPDGVLISVFVTVDMSVFVFIEVFSAGKTGVSGITGKGSGALTVPVVVVSLVAVLAVVFIVLVVSGKGTVGTETVGAASVIAPTAIASVVVTETCQ